MAWTTPKTDFGSETMTAAQANALGTNLEYLFSPNSSYYLPDTTDYTTTSTSFTSINATLGTFKHQIDTDGGNALVIGTIVYEGSGVNPQQGHWDIEVDGVSISNGSGMFSVQVAANYEATLPVIYPVEGLSDGTHTFELKWKVTSGTGKIYAGDASYQSFFGVVRMG